MDFSTIKGVTLPGNLEVKKMQHGNDVLWEAGEPDYSLLPFFVENRTNSSGYVTVKKNSSYAPTLTIYKSTDNVNWTSAGTTSTSNMNITLPANGRVYLRCTADSWWFKNANNNVGIDKISFNKSVNIGGNIMSLLYGENFVGQTSFPSGSSNNFNELFSGATNLVDASKLVLPATTLTEYCYYNMFLQATDLTTPPSVLPATTLANNCYGQMFYKTPITTAPELPATTLATRCYSFMFYNCTSLTTAPELPALTLVNNCYSGMFASCSNLNYIKAWFITTPSTTYTAAWVDGVAASGTFVKNAEATWNVSGIYGIPSGWTIIRTFPDAETEPFYIQNETNTAGTISIVKNNNSANTMTIYTSTDKINWASAQTSTSNLNITLPANGRVYFRQSGQTCWGRKSSGSTYYYTYFSDVTVNFSIGGNIMSLFYGGQTNQYDTQLTINQYACYNMFYYNTRLVSADKLVMPATTLYPNCYYGMFQGCTGLTSAPALPATTLASNCYQYMFLGCALTQAPELPATTLATYCYHNMFRNCTSLITAPELPATTLVNNCYSAMFMGCSSLNYIKAMFTTTPSTSYTDNWVNGVAASGTFVKNASATWNVTGISGVPSGWTVQTAAS